MRKILMEPTDEQLKALQEGFEKTLIFPDKKDDLPQFVLCPIGIVGSGKTTVMEPLCERLGVLRISSDELRAIFKRQDFRWDRVTETALLIGEKYAQEGYNIGFDSDCVRPEKQQRIKEIAAVADASLIWIHIDPPEDFIINKLRSHEPTWLFGDPERLVENYYQRKPLHENLDLPFVYTFDTSRDDLDRQIAEGAESIRAILTT